MDTLSTSAFTLKLPFLPTTQLLHHPHFKPLHPPPLPSPSIATASPSSFVSSSIPLLHLNRSHITFHRKAASGYAAALIDVAQCKGSLHRVADDVRRLSRLASSLWLEEFLKCPSTAGDAEKVQVLREISRRGKFHKHLVVLLEMFIRKNKVGIVCEVVEEFMRIHQGLIMTGGIVAFT